MISADCNKQLARAYIDAGCIEAQYYPSFGEAQLSIGIGAAEKSGDQHARSEMEGLLNELS
jgi:hypothetical protein